jgi:DNA polymerase-3 subunit alpha
MPQDTAVAAWRSRLYGGVTDILQFGQRSWEDKARGQSDLFGAATTEETMDLGSLPQTKMWTQGEMSSHEKAAVGFYLSVHPLDSYKETLERLNILALADYEGFAPGQTVFLAGLVSGMQVRYSKKGNRFGTFRLEDRSGGIKCIAWGETFGRISGLLKDDVLIIAEGRIEGSEGQEETLIINDVKLLADAQPMRAREAAIKLPDADFDERFYEQVFRLLSDHKGECGVSLTVSAGKVEAHLEVAHIRVKGSAKLEQELEKLGCSVDWVI